MLWSSSGELVLVLSVSTVETMNVDDSVELTDTTVDGAADPTVDSGGGSGVVEIVTIFVTFVKFTTGRDSVVETGTVSVSGTNVVVTVFEDVIGNEDVSREEVVTVRLAFSTETVVVSD